MAATYKTKNGMQSGFVPGVGAIVGGMIEGPDNLESSNLLKVEQPQAASAAPVSSPSAAPNPASAAPNPPAVPPQAAQSTNTNPEAN